MRYWIINQYETTPATGIGGRWHHIAGALARSGHSTALFCAKNHHLSRPAQNDDLNETDYERIAIPTLPNAGSRGLRRMLNWFVFAALVPIYAVMRFERPDAIVYSSPSLPGAVSAQILAFTLRARFVFDIRDIWPLTLVELGGARPNAKTIRFLDWIETRSLKRAHLVTSNLAGLPEHIETKGIEQERFLHLPNGVAELPGPGEGAFLETAEAKTFVFGYAGTIGEANDLATLIHAAGLLPETLSVRFDILGDGPLRAELERTAEDVAPNRFRFLGRKPKSEVTPFLKSCDCCVILWKPVSLYRFGIAANKLFDYMAAGRPVINAYGGRYDPIALAEAGLTVSPGDPAELAGALQEMIGLDTKTRCEMGAAGRAYVAEKHLYPKIATTLDRRLSDLVQKGRLDPFKRT